MVHASRLVSVLAATAALTACGSSADDTVPKNRVILLGRAIGPISLNEPRATVRKLVGPGKQSRQGLVSYFGGRLLISYWFHDQLTDRVAYIKTTWPGFETHDGVHVRTGRRVMHFPAGSCIASICSLAAGTGPDAPGTGFGIRDGRIAWIAVGYG